MSSVQSRRQIAKTAANATNVCDVGTGRNETATETATATATVAAAAAASQGLARAQLRLSGIELGHSARVSVPRFSFRASPVLLQANSCAAHTVGQVGTKSK